MRESDWREFDLFAPTPEHALLAETLREFVAREVEPQAADHDRREAFNHALFRSAGELGLLGVTLPEQYGGAGLDAVAAVQVYEALSSADPGFSLAVLAHAILFAQNVSVNGDEARLFCDLASAFLFVESLAPTLPHARVCEIIPNIDIGKY